MAERPGIVLSWTEAFRIVPELAEAEVQKLGRELEASRLLVGYAWEAYKALGVGNNAYAREVLERLMRNAGFDPLRGTFNNGP